MQHKLIKILLKHKKQNRQTLYYYYYMKTNFVCLEIWPYQVLSYNFFDGSLSFLSRNSHKKRYSGMSVTNSSICLNQKQKLNQWFLISAEKKIKSTQRNKNYKICHKNDKIKGRTTKELHI